MQMGSNMKATIFNERIVAALRTWHQKARKEVRRKRGSVTASGTPSPSMSPVHLLRHFRSEVDSSVHTSPRRSVEADSYTASPPHRINNNINNINNNYYNQQQQLEMEPQRRRRLPPESRPSAVSSVDVEQHEIDIVPTKEFSFDKRISFPSASTD